MVIINVRFMTLIARACARKFPSASCVPHNLRVLSERALVIRQLKTKYKLRKAITVMIFIADKIRWRRQCKFGTQIPTHTHSLI